MKKESKKNKKIMDEVANWRNRGFKGILTVESDRIKGVGDDYKVEIELFTQVRPEGAATTNPAVIMEIHHYDCDTGYRLEEAWVYVFTVEKAFKTLHFSVVDEMSEAKKVWVY